MNFFPMNSGGGNIQPDFFDNVYTTSSASTYTFTQDLEYCYVCANSNDPLGTSDSAVGKLTQTTGSSATMTKVYTPSVSSNHWGVINLIENIKAGDTYKFPVFSVNANNRSMGFLIGH